MRSGFTPLSCILAALLAAIWTLLPAPARSEDQLVHAQGEADGDLVARLKPAGSNLISYVEIDPRRHRLDLVTPKDGRGASLREIIAEEGAAMAFTGGFLSSFDPPRPAGYLLVDGVERSRLVRGDPMVDAVLCILRGDGAAPLLVARVERFRRPGAAEDCVQTGPLLIEAGKVVLEPKRRDPLNRLGGDFERAFLILDREGRIVLAVSSSTPLPSLLATLLAPAEKGGFGAQTAVALTGSTTAGLILRGGLGFSFGTTTVALPSAIVVDGASSRP